MPRRPAAAAAAAVALLTLSSTAACGDGGDAAAGGGKTTVVTAFYPLQFLSERIGGDAVTVSNLTKPGTEPHDVELTPRQVAEVADATLVVHLRGFQPAVDAAVERAGKDRAFDAAGVVDLLPPADGHGGTDPHVWLDPVRYATIAGKLADRLGQADPAHAASFSSRAAALRTELEQLDAEYTAALATCQRRELVTSHTAFNYLATRYRLTQIGITGITPEDEPSPQRLARVAADARAHGATTIYFETLVSPKVAETIAREVGAKTAVLDPLEGLTGTGGDYFTVMRANLTALTTGLGCTG